MGALTRSRSAVFAMAVLQELLDSELIPTGQGALWRGDVAWLEVGADALLAGAYYGLALALLILVWRRSVGHMQLLLMLLTTFALAAGTMHLLAVPGAWYPIAGLQGSVKLLAAALATAAAVLAWVGRREVRTWARLRAAPDDSAPTRVRRADDATPADAQLQQLLADRDAALERCTRELELQARRMARINDGKDRFLGVLAHELRAPLAPIRNAAFLLRESDLDAPQQIERFARLIDDQVGRLAGLIDDLDDVQRIVSGRIDLHREDLDPAELVRTAVANVQPLLDERRHRLTVHLPSERFRLHADPVRLRQALVHLLRNAAQYTDAGGSLSLEVTVSGDAATIRVCDDGPGIGPEQREALFDMFSRAERSAAGGKAGLGVGLAVARGLVELHGGTLTLHSEGPGKGSEFRLELPAAVRAPSIATAEPADGLHGMRILVVDDHRLSADSLRDALRHEGAEAQAVYTGAEALSLIAALRPQVLLLDLGLPDLSGEEVARRVRQLPELAPLHIVALTGYSADVRACRSADFDQHLLKPVELGTLVRVLASLRA